MVPVPGWPAVMGARAVGESVTGPAPWRSLKVAAM